MTTKKNIILKSLLIIFIVILAIGFTTNSIYYDNYAQSDEITIQTSYAYYAGQWWMQEDYLNLAAAKTFLDSIQEFDADNPIVIAVIDSGVYIGHEIFRDYDPTGEPDSVSSGDYVDLIYRNELNQVIGACTVGGVVSTNEADILDIDHHGTHVAGIIALLTRYLGLSEYIKIMPIRAGHMDGGKVVFSSIALRKAVEFAVNNGAHVINMSLGGEVIAGTYTPSEIFSLYSYIFDAYNDDVFIVAAAGNGSKSTQNYECYPAYIEQVLSVMSYSYTSISGSDASGMVLSSFSNYGNYDLIAPGYNIISSIDYSKPIQFYRYQSFNGTSMATPMASFASALVRLLYPDYSVGQVMTVMEKHPSDTMQYTVGITDYEAKVMSIVSLVSGDYDGRDDYIFYENPSSITISEQSNGTEFNTGDNLTFNASINSSFPVSPNIELDWYVNGVYIATVLHTESFYYTHNTAETIVVQARHSGLNMSSNLTILEIYEAPLDVEITYNGYIGDGYSYNAQVLPYGVNPNLMIEWYVDDVLIDTLSVGETFIFNPDNILHTYAIKAYAQGTSVYDVSILEIIPTLSELTIDIVDGSLVQTLDNLNNATFKAYGQTEGIDQSTIIDWYVNDVLYSQLPLGSDFIFNTTSLLVGEYTIRAEYNDIVCNEELTLLIFYAYPDSIEITMVSGESEQVLGNTHNVTLSANLEPLIYISPEAQDNIVWYINDIELSMGDTIIIDFTSFLYGEYVIYAQYENIKSNLITISLLYAEVETLFIYLIEGYQNQSLNNLHDVVFKGVLNPQDYVNPTYVGDIEWYVNGNYVMSGEYFTFDLKDLGAYVISARYGELMSNNFTLLISYAHPQDISIEHIDGNLQQTVDSLIELTFIAALDAQEYANPDAVHDIKWHINHTHYFNGESLSYIPQTAGEYIIYATYGSYISNSYILTVSYLPATSLGISISGDISLNQVLGNTESVSFSALLSPALFIDPSEYSNIIWYVNGIESHNGEHFTCHKITAGNYSIHAEYNQFTSNYYVLTIEYAIPNELTISHILGSLEYTAGDNELVRFQAFMQPSDYINIDNYTLIEWYVNNKKVAIGAIYNALINTAGEHIVSARYNGLTSNEYIIIVEAQPIINYSVSINASYSGDVILNDIIIFNSIISPANGDLTLIWYLNDTEISQGVSYAFTADNIGAYQVYCMIMGLDISSNIINFNVLSATQDNDNNDKDDGDPDDDPTLNITIIKKEQAINTYVLNGLDNETLTINWYVNGVLTYTGTEFIFSPEDNGEYIITAEINDVMIDSGDNIVNVIGDDNNNGNIVNNDFSELLSLIIIIAMAAIFIIIITILIFKMTRLKHI